MEQFGELVVDADVLIDATRGQPQAIHFIKEHQYDITLSSATIAELYAGTRGAREEGALAALLDLFDVVDVTEAIAVQAGKYRNRYGKSHGSGLVDCIIAATADACGGTLVTLNRKHYPMCERLLVPYKKG